MNPIIESVLAGKIAPLGAHGKRSAIHKVALTARTRVGETGLEGDYQYERKHHGGPEKALHHYSRDHYVAWRDEWLESSAGPAGGGALRATRGLCGAKL